MDQYDVILRYCGKIGWLAIVMIGDEEVYRTGKHHKGRWSALEAVIEWEEQQGKFIGGMCGNV